MINDDLAREFRPMGIDGPMLRDFSRFIDGRLSFLTRFERKELLAEYKRRLERTSYRSANIWLRKLTDRALSALNESAFMRPLTGNKAALYGDRELKQYAEAHARECQARIADFSDTAGDDYEANLLAVYETLSVYSAGHKITAPYTGVKSITPELLESALLKLICPKWWLRKLTRQRDELKEYMQICIGKVGKSVSPYISKKGLYAHRQKRRSNADFLAIMEAVSEDGEITALADLFEASSNHPDKRYIEMSVRCRGLTELADELNYCGELVTITTPSKYHRVSSKWAGFNPRAGQQYLTRLWAQIRAELKRRDIGYFGVRVAEPHADATPHWHLLLFVNPDHRKTLLSIMRSYSLREDGNEPGAVKNRFDNVTIDKSKGNAAAYIAKYLAKNISAKTLTDDDDVDHEAGTSAGEGVERAVAWASTWRIRQFQFFGAAAVTVWRELRRLKEPAANERLEAIRAAADATKWAEFQKLVTETPVMLDRVDDGVTEYNEPKTRIVGVALKNGPGIVTRATRWLLRKCGDSRITWKNVSNCTDGENDSERDGKTSIKQAGGRSSAVDGASENNPGFFAQASSGAFS